MRQLSSVWVERPPSSPVASMLVGDKTVDVVATSAASTGAAGGHHESCCPHCASEASPVVGARWRSAEAKGTSLAASVLKQVIQFLAKFT